MGGAKRDPYTGRIPSEISNETPESDDAALEYRINERTIWLQVNAEAQRRFKAEQAQQLSKQVKPPITLKDFLAVPDGDPKYRIDRLLPYGGRALLSAQYKAGKTSLVDNLVKALADNRLFLNEFRVLPARVVLIDTEMDERQMRRWLRSHSIQNTEQVSVIPLRGACSTFNILDADVMAMWVEWLTGYEVIVLDCLRPVLDALGLSEDKDAGRFLVAFDELLNRCGATEAVVTTHMGHSGERSRGDSRLMDWPDVNWRIVKDKDADNPDDPAVDRYFSAYGRDVEIPEGKLDYTPETRELSYLGISRKSDKAAHLVPKVVELVRARPGLTKNDIERADELKGCPRQQIRDALATALANNDIYAEKSSDSSHAIRHYLNPSRGGYELDDGTKYYLRNARAIASDDLGSFTVENLASVASGQAQPSGDELRKAKQHMSILANLGYIGAWYDDDGATRWRLKSQASHA